ncbi:MAG TPA: hypothetical protein VHX64_17535 [Caulobacteraceae bacterium]|nr:hypothetical protein [Caulobacteraceae bacterium]
MDKATEEADWLDDLLRKRPVEAVADDGFAWDLTMALPRRPDPYRWFGPVAAIVGLAFAGVLSGGGVLRALGDLAGRIPGAALSPVLGEDAGVRAGVIIAVIGLATTWSVGIWALCDRRSRG